MRKRTRWRRREAEVVVVKMKAQSGVFTVHVPIGITTLPFGNTPAPACNSGSTIPNHLLSVILPTSSSLNAVGYTLCVPIKTAQHRYTIRLRPQTLRQSHDLSLDSRMHTLGLDRALTSSVLLLDITTARRFDLRYTIIILKLTAAGASCSSPENLMK
jgi:hypothetical protein